MGKTTGRMRQVGHRRSRRLAGAFAVGAALALLATACTRGADEVQSGGSETTAAGSDSGGDGAPASGDFGDLSGVCGPGDAGGDTAQGVTDDSIQVGTISDPGFTGRPGLNQELFDATEVFTSWCNDAGGINGRTIEVTERDAKLTEYKQRITEACGEDFMLVGGGGVFDDTGQDERLGCLLPDIAAYRVSPAARAADLAISPVPVSLDELTVGVYQYLERRFPDSTDSVGFLTGNVPSLTVVDRQNQEAVESLGWDITYEAQYNALGESSWTPFAQALASNDVRGMVYTGEPENLAALLQAIKNIDYELDWTVASANAIDERFIELGGDAVSDVYITSSIVPSFLADQNPATQQYLDLFDEYLPDGKAEALLGYNSFSAWLLFATAVGECGSEVTRSCVFEAAAGIDDWTGGGLHAPTNPGDNETSRCYLVVEATPDGFAVPDDFESTDDPFRCDEDSVVPLEGDYGSGTTLESVGKSMDDLE